MLTRRMCFRCVMVDFTCVRRLLRQLCKRLGCAVYAPSRRAYDLTIIKRAWWRPPAADAFQTAPLTKAA
jgi:hypothetical protein